MRFALVLTPVFGLLAAEASAQNIVLAPQKNEDVSAPLQPAIDGAVDWVEYADGKKLVLQNFKSQPGAGNTDGSGFLMVSSVGGDEVGWLGDTMFLGLELPFNTGAPSFLYGVSTGGLEISIDSFR